MGLAAPALNSIMSKTVPPTEQGELQGALACIGSLTSIAAPPLLTNLFAYFTSASAPVYFPGSAFLAAALSLAAAALVFIRMRPQPAMTPAERNRVREDQWTLLRNRSSSSFMRSFCFLESGDPAFVPIGMGHFDVR